MKTAFEALPLIQFWVKQIRAFPKLAEIALKVLLPFTTTYLCEAGFSVLMQIKTKQRHSLAVESDMRLALSRVRPRIEALVASKKEEHKAHAAHSRKKSC